MKERIIEFLTDVIAAVGVELMMMAAFCILWGRDFIMRVACVGFIRYYKKYYAGCYYRTSIYIIMYC